MIHCVICFLLIPFAPNAFILCTFQWIVYVFLSLLADPESRPGTISFKWNASLLQRTTQIAGSNLKQPSNWYLYPIFRRMKETGLTFKENHMDTGKIYLPDMKLCVFPAGSQCSYLVFMSYSLHWSCLCWCVHYSPNYVNTTPSSILWTLTNKLLPHICMHTIV